MPYCNLLNLLTQRTFFEMVNNEILITLIFWLTKSIFFFPCAIIFAKELGALIGLSIGYRLKSY